MDRKFLIQRIIELGIRSKKDLEIGKYSTKRLERMYRSREHRDRRDYEEVSGNFPKVISYGQRHVHFNINPILFHQKVYYDDKDREEQELIKEFKKTGFYKKELKTTDFLCMNCTEFILNSSQGELGTCHVRERHGDFHKSSSICNSFIQLEAGETEESFTYDMDYEEYK